MSDTPIFDELEDVIPMVETDEDPISLERGDPSYDDTEEGAVGDEEIPQPSVYSAEEVGGVEETPGGDS